MTSHSEQRAANQLRGFLCVCVSDMMVGMGYSREEINDSLTKMKYDDITATYLLLGHRAAEVRGGNHGNSRWRVRAAVTVFV